MVPVSADAACGIPVAWAQLQVTPGTSLPSNWTVDSLVSKLLAGNGVEVFNCKINGHGGNINCNMVMCNDIVDYQIYIYDRGGVLIFESQQPDEPWNGTAQNGEKCPMGTYVYHIKYSKKTEPGLKLVKVGTVLLIR